MLLNDMKLANPGEIIYDKGEKQSVTGLRLRCFPLRKVFYLYYRTREGKQRMPKIGVYGQITLSQARSISKELLEKVARGEDPQKEWSTARSEKTLKDLYKEILNRHWNKKRFVESGRTKEVEGLYHNHIGPKLGSYRLSEISSMLVRNWHASFENATTTGNRALEVLGTIFTQAMEQELHGSNPCKVVKSFPERKRNRFATVEEIHSILERLDFYRDEYPDHALFIYLVLYTGCRPSTLRRITWDRLKRVEKDGQIFGVVTFHGKSTAESGEQEVVIIPPEAMVKVDAAALRPNTRSKRIVRINWPHVLWDKICKDLGITDLWVRDLRRTFATVGLSTGENVATIGELLNHKSAQTTKIYAKLMEESRFKAVSNIANSITKIGRPNLKLVN